MELQVLTKILKMIFSLDKEEANALVYTSTLSTDFTPLAVL